jgi:hypothetical protein
MTRTVFKEGMAGATTGAIDALGDAFTSLT